MFPPNQSLPFGQSAKPAAQPDDLAAQVADLQQRVAALEAEDKQEQSRDIPMAGKMSSKPAMKPREAELLRRVIPRKLLMWRGIGSP